MITIKQLNDYNETIMTERSALTTSSLVPPIICVEKNQQLKDKRFPII
jgi:hypothetical protein